MTAEIETVAQEVAPVINGVEKEEVAAGDSAAEVKQVVENGVKSKMNGEAHVEPEAAPVVNGDVKVELNGEALVENGDVAAPAEETTNEAAEEVAKEPEAPPKVILHTWPPIKNLPTTSMFCLKLETYLKMHSETIPYETQYGYKVGKNGKVPWIEYKGEKVSDSSLIIDFLNEKFEIENIDAKLPEQKKHVARAIQVMLEENTYWGLQYHRFVDNYSGYKKLISEQSGMSGASGLVFSGSQKMQQRKVRSGLDMHGLGKHTKDEVYAIASKDIKALSGLLGDQTYLLGDQVSTVDIVAFSLVAQITQSGLDSPLKTLLESEECTNLITHYNTIKEAYWGNWDEKVLGDRPAAPLKKGFSFRKKKSAKAPKEEEATSPAPEENGVASEDTTPAEGEAATEAEATEAATTTEETPVAETPAVETPVAEATPETPAEAPETPAAPAETTTDATPAAAATPAETAVVNGDATVEEKPAE